MKANTRTACLSRRRGPKDIPPRPFSFVCILRLLLWPLIPPLANLLIVFLPKSKSSPSRSSVLSACRSIFTKQNVPVVTRDGPAHYNVCTYFGMPIKLFLFVFGQDPLPPFRREYGFKKFPNLRTTPKHRLWDDNSVPNPAGTRAAALFDDFTLTQTVMSPTRFSPDGQSSSVLDLFAIDRHDLVVSTEVHGDPISDHCYVTSTLSLRSPLPPKQTVTRFDDAHADWHGLRETLNMTPLMLALSETHNVNIAWSVWKE